eukprot:58306-Pyramimonas_sp.AAC.1
MLDADNPESESFDLSDSSVATAATAVKAVELSATNTEFDEWLQYMDHLTSEGLQDITLHSYLTPTRRTTREQHTSIRDEYAYWREEQGAHAQDVSYF